MVDGILDHVGIAVRRIEQSLPLYCDVLGAPLVREEVVLGERCRVAFLGRGETHVELLEPIDGEGPIGEFLRKRGEGIHHLCFRVADMASALERARSAGLRVVGEAPRAGAGGCLVAFLHPASAGGVLIELSQARP